jgi:hypothetical protein
MDSAKSQTNNDPRLESAATVQKECFWGDYLITPEQILDRLDKKDARFQKFLFSKIMENSSYPSRHLRNLFPTELLQSLIEKYLERSGAKMRGRIIAANITGNADLAPEYRWKL